MGTEALSYAGPLLASPSANNNQARSGSAVRREMDNLQHSEPAVAPPRNEVADSAARIRFRQPVSTAGYVDAAWWPRSLDLTAELPALLDVMWTAGREISRVTYSIAGWAPAPRRLRVE